MRQQQRCAYNNKSFSNVNRDRDDKVGVAPLTHLRIVFVVYVPIVIDLFAKLKIMNELLHIYSLLFLFLSFKSLVSQCDPNSIASINSIVYMPAVS